ncbi:hypothetical protein BU15DRAFT_54845 [Melanogaster broomeanus]|nr:hypothetical protein BU15DRAFT_54845 [Melanogaster broomeanus]
MKFPRISKPHIRGRLHLFSPPKRKSRTDQRGSVPLNVEETALDERADLAGEFSEPEYEYDDEEEGIECGCCFASCPFEQMAQCPEAHLFCTTCIMSYASNQLGKYNPNVPCMDQSGCKLPFPDSELRRVLTPKLLDFYYRVKQRKEIEAAGLGHLEECPRCEYKCVIENDVEKLFRCENRECGAVTCRKCKKPDHLPRRCDGASVWSISLDAQHVVEEAMTRALKRNCPKCQQSFIKISGCNKMTCSSCGTFSCYVCREIIEGYNHYQSSHRPGVMPWLLRMCWKSKPICSLCDPVEERHAEEVRSSCSNLNHTAYQHRALLFFDCLYQIYKPTRYRKRPNAHWRSSRNPAQTSTRRRLRACSDTQSLANFVVYVIWWKSDMQKR